MLLSRVMRSAVASALCIPFTAQAQSDEIKSHGSLVSQEELTPGVFHTIFKVPEQVVGNCVTNGGRGELKTRTGVLGVVTKAYKCTMLIMSEKELLEAKVRGKLMPLPVHYHNIAVDADYRTRYTYSSTDPSKRFDVRTFAGSEGGGGYYPSKEMPIAGLYHKIEIVCSTPISTKSLEELEKYCGDGTEMIAEARRRSAGHGTTSLLGFVR